MQHLEETLLTFSQSLSYSLLLSLLLSVFLPLFLCLSLSLYLSLSLFSSSFAALLSSTIYSYKLNFQLKQISQNTFQYQMPPADLLLHLLLPVLLLLLLLLLLLPLPSHRKVRTLPHGRIERRATGVTFFKLGNKFLISLLVVLPRCRAKDIFNKSFSSTLRNAKTRQSHTHTHRHRERERRMRAYEIYIRQIDD